MTDQLTSSQAERDRARQRLRATVASVRARLDPERLRVESTEKARATISAVPGQIADAARKRPGLVAGIVSGVALLLFRKPIFGAVKRLTEEKDNG